ncbi:hypothetical protein RCL1_005017 [Eukaryota sp. TZLM3-RCL]
MQSQRVIERRITVPLPVISLLLRDSGNYIKNLRGQTGCTIVANYAAQPGVVLVRGTVLGVQNAVHKILSDWEWMCKETITRVLYCPGSSATKYTFVKYNPFLYDGESHIPHYVLKCVESGSSASIQDILDTDFTNFSHQLSHLVQSISTGNLDALQSIDTSSLPKPPFRAWADSFSQVISTIKHFLNFFQENSLSPNVRIRSVPGRTVFHTISDEFLPPNVFSLTDLQLGLQQKKFLMGFAPGVDETVSSFESEIANLTAMNRCFEEEKSQTVKVFTYDTNEVLKFNTEFSAYRTAKKELDDVADDVAAKDDVDYDSEKEETTGGHNLPPKPTFFPPTSVFLNIHSSNPSDLCVRSSGRVLLKIPLLLSPFSDFSTHSTDLLLILSLPCTELPPSCLSILAKMVKHIRDYPNEGNQWGLSNLPDWSILTSTDGSLISYPTPTVDYVTPTFSTLKMCSQDSNLTVTIPSMIEGQNSVDFLIPATTDVDDRYLFAFPSMRSSLVPFFSLSASNVITNCSCCDYSIVPFNSAKDAVIPLLLVFQSFGVVMKWGKTGKKMETQKNSQDRPRQHQGFRTLERSTVQPEKSTVQHEKSTVQPVRRQYQQKNYQRGGYQAKREHDVPDLSLSDFMTEVRSFKPKNRR